MNGDIYSLAQLIAQELSEFSAEVQLAPEYELAELATARCVVVPVSSSSVRLTRSVTEHQYQIDIGLMYRQKKLDEDSLLDNVKKISDTLRGKRFSTAVCTKADPSPLYDSEQMRERNQFTSVISATFKEICR